MRQYELMIILDPEIEERTVAPSLDKYLSVIKTDGGSVDKVDIWGRRRLAYDINKKSEGIYAVVDFTSTSDTAKELDRQLGLNEASCGPRSCARTLADPPRFPRPTVLHRTLHAVARVGAAWWDERRENVTSEAHGAVDDTDDTRRSWPWQVTPSSR